MVTILLSLLGHIKILFLVLSAFVSQESGKGCLALTFQSMQPGINLYFRNALILRNSYSRKLIICASWPGFSIFIQQIHILIGYLTLS